MSEIKRYDSNARLSRVVVHNGVAYIAGVTASNTSGDAKAQTLDILAKIDGYLASVNIDKTRMLTVQIWLKDIDRDFALMNEAWAEWAPKDALPTRATGESRLATPDLLVEIIVTAAI
ncbi:MULTISPECIES: RidA family protein [unclassified Acidovorax]|jgi:enamine deaminase RidA (YjgF/YER057c/UK114 family)|uniref:RidA family protein n=1 Tax=unclassified Acidovorax TaxID=2684926 RepID=UPI000B402F40|nr:MULTISPECIES: RidA family protein [unclassified Acidovorax]MBP3981334.1 RidA family protein [Acidovorax sp. JG5]